MSWFKRLEDRLSNFVHEVGQDAKKIGTEVVQDVEKIGSETWNAAKDVFNAGKAAVTEVVRDAPKIAVSALEDTYQQLVGNDLKVIRDPHATLTAKIDAAVDLASTFALPAEKIPVMIGEVALKNVVQNGESVALKAAMASLQKSGDVPAMIGVEAALLKVDPAVGKMLTAAGVDTKQAQKTLDAVQAAVAAGKDIPVSAKAIVAELGTAFTGPGSFKDRISEIPAALNALQTITQDLASVKSGVTAVGGVLLPGPPAPPPAAPALGTENGMTVVTMKNTILALEDGSAITPAVIAALKAEQAAHPDKNVLVAGKDIGPGTLAALKTAGIEVAGARQLAQALGGTSAAPAITPSAAPPSESDLVKETLAKIPPETIERIQRSGRAEIGLPHPDATPWNGKPQTGSVTSVIGSRVEQYTGRGWTTYDAAQLAPLQAQLSANAVAQDPSLMTKISPGDELRVGANGSIALVPHDPQQPGLKSVTVEPGGASHNVEPAALQR